MSLSLFSPNNMTSNNAPSPYIAAASSRYSSTHQAFKAFNGSAGGYSYWITAGTSTGWLRIYIGAASKLLTKYSIQVNEIPEPDRAPKDWTLEGSNDASSWDTLDTVTNETSWTSGEIREFTPDTITNHYKYFRINVTANNGDTYLQVAELCLYEWRTPLNYLQNRGRNRLSLLPVSLGITSLDG